MIDTSLRVHDLRKRFGGTVALDGVSLEIPRGTLTGLVGSDGAGKTTLIRIVAGLERADSGVVELFPDSREHRRRNEPIIGRVLPRWHRSQGAQPAVGYLSQGFSLYSDLSINENMQFFASLYGVTDYNDRATRLLTLVGLEPFRTRRAGKLSGGMKKKLALACALIHEPRLLLLDEPTTGVDPVSRREFWSILSRLQHDGMSVLLATPYFDEAERCDHIVLMHAGHAIESGSPDVVAATTPGTMFEVVCSAVKQVRTALTGDPRITEVQLYGDRVHVRTKDTEAAADSKVALDVVIRLLLSEAGISVQSMREIRPSLENAFIAHMSERMEAHSSEKEAS
ncbi:ABC transporter ATP-binding protein [Spirochaeta africana]|uniref:ABC-type multidrug transport system, ATPase component n=1 Tax=Spirochaeta africana (strain ATCC 700263 / DSM 8902 / Z-7692) TaxID=889378 RepID=H9UHU2_SPIAZ|nr:ABC transporter ATP-binding protein [Spirochaeta africana]AFG37085.1 ABC-type multidrug transport system, ATPase component [Spirochaeta africana DSM 8902]